MAADTKHEAHPHRQWRDTKNPKTQRDGHTLDMAKGTSTPRTQRNTHQEDATRRDYMREQMRPLFFCVPGGTVHFTPWRKLCSYFLFFGAPPLVLRVPSRVGRGESKVGFPPAPVAGPFWGFW